MKCNKKSSVAKPNIRLGGQFLCILAQVITSQTPVYLGNSSHVGIIHGIDFNKGTSPVVSFFLLE